MIGLVIAGIALILLITVSIYQEVMWDIEREKVFGYELEQMKGGKE